MINIHTPINNIPGIGEFYSKKLAKLGIFTIEEILLHTPHRYEDFSKISNISDLESGKSYTVKAQIKGLQNKKIFKKNMVLTEGTISDKTGSIGVTWFNQSYLINSISEKDIFFLSGKVGIRSKKLSLTNPSFERVSSDPTHTGGMIPVYPETRGLSSKWLRFVIKNILEKTKGNIPDILPKKILREYLLLSREESLRKIHFPISIKEIKNSKKRLSFEQIFLIQIAILGEKIRISREKAVSIPINIKSIKKFTSLLEFKLTDAQKKSSWRILKDMERDYPMNRLLEGDVGSGKTIVATMAIANTAKAGFQSAFMAPTEVLAKQHFKEIFKVLKNFNMNIGLLTGKEDKYYSKKLKSDFIEISRKKLLEKTLDGEIDLLIGTHALIQDKVKFKNLALVILDEQHRFGVKQRSKMITQKREDMKKIPHLLSMTATPIPRTLAMSIYGDLDLSLIDELPKGRKKIITKMIMPNDRKKAYSVIREEVKKNRQAFVICPKIEPSTEIDKISKWSTAKAVKEEHKILSDEIFPEFSVGLIHGKMAIKEKERAMKNFRNGKTDILVSTSVVEVGIDVPNATVIMIEGADRFGLAQLHQLRGRVGRDKNRSYCFLVPESFSEKTKKRIKAIVNCNNGFKLAERDLELRGPGDFIGSRQWGIPDIAMGAFSDMKLVESARDAARTILEESISLNKYPLLKSKIAEIRKKMHLE